MAKNAILMKSAPAGPYESEEEAAEELEPGHVMELIWSTDHWEIQLNTSAIPGLRVAEGGFQEGLDQVYADGDELCYLKVQSGEAVQAYVFGENSGGGAAVAEGDVLYKTAEGDHSTTHPGELDINSTNGVAVAKAKEAVDSSTSSLIKVEKL